MAELSQRAQQAMTDVELLQGEEVARVWEADGFFLGTHPLLKLMGKIQSMVVTLTGGHIRVFLVVTNMRVLLVQSTQMWCGCQKVRGANAISMTSVKEAGIGRETQMCCFHSRVIHIQTLTQRHTLIVKGFSDEDMKSFLAYMSWVLVSNARTV